MEDTAKRFCSILFDVLAEKGVKNVVCSPGSRNVPLLLAVSSREKIKKHFAVDERSAGFLGLGISLVSREPVGLVCTSGTALLNYAPAVAEAYYQSIPLVVISADRPMQWIDQDDSQTLRQDGALTNYVKKSYTIPSLGDDNPEMQWYVNRIANDAIAEATGGRPGPVHINIHLGEPLGEKCPKITTVPRLISIIEGDSVANKEVIKSLALRLAEKKVMLVAGFQTPDADLQKAVATFSRFENVTVMAETISNLHLDPLYNQVDSVLTAYEPTLLDKYSADIVISIGGALVSRKLKEYLRRNAHKCEHWSVGRSHTTSDPFMSLTLRIETPAARFFRSINSVLKKKTLCGETGDFRQLWNNLRIKADRVKSQYSEKCGWSELKAFEYILKHLPSDFNLFLSNGTPVRYAQLIKYPLPHASYCNRGVSGIDGSLSTAIGGGIAYKGRSILITGDLSMAYDVGALGLKNVPENFKIIVMDNQGGGIFRFIPSTSELEEREEYLCQAPHLPLRHLAEGYGWEYFDCDNLSTLKNNFEAFISSPRKSILKITVEGKHSVEYLKKYMTLKV